MPSKPHRGPEDPADAFDVFISYARPSGLEYAKALRDALAARGRLAFVDAQEVPLGARWAEIIEERHRWSTVTVAVITADSPGSLWQEAEVARALAQARAKSGPSHFAYAWPCPGSRTGHIWPDIPGSIALLDYPKGATPAAAAAAVARELAASLSVLDGRDEPPESEAEPEAEPEQKPAAESPRLPPQSPPHFPPAWAVEWGHDEYGPYASFALERVIQRMRWCPPGRFMMGPSPEEAAKGPVEGDRHEVSLAHGFWMADTPVTRAFARELMILTGGFIGTYYVLDPRLPVDALSRRDAVDLAARVDALLATQQPSGDLLVVRLPTEAEWEYACRAGTATPHYLGTEPAALDKIAWHAGNAQSEPKPVGHLLPNAWGLYDMLGNIWEWCLNEPEELAPAGEPVRKDEDRRELGVARGGGCGFMPSQISAAGRWRWRTDMGVGDMGLRLCIGPPLPDRA